MIATIVDPDFAATPARCYNLEQSERAGGRSKVIDVEHTYRQYAPMVLRRCRRLLRDEEAAHEAMQDTFVRLLRYEDRLEATGLSSLLYRMATQVCLNRIRSQRRRPEVPDADLIARVANAPDAEERFGARRLLDRIFKREPESTRTIALLHLLDGMTLAEVAREVGMSVSGVRKRLRQLKAHVQELEEVDR